jgi:hypothetical protein
MSSMKKKTKAVILRGRSAVARVGKVAKLAAIAAAKEGAATALAVGVLEAERRWKETSPAVAKKRSRNGAAVLLGGAAVLGAAGLAIAGARRRKRFAP